MDRAIKLMLLMFLSLAGCKDKAGTIAPVPSATQPAPPIDAGVPKKELTSTVSLAAFSKDNNLLLCTEWHLSVSTDKPDAQAKLAKMIENVSKPDKDEIKLQKTCGEQFADRTAVAKCIAKDVTIFYYTFHELTDDFAMKLCLKDGSNWEAVSRDSPEYERAKLEADRRHLKKLEDSMEKH